MNRKMTSREQRVVRYASVGIAIYLALFGGFKLWKFFHARRAEYRGLVAQAEDLRRQMLPYREKAVLVKKMMDDFHLDPATLKRETVVSDASAAIQKAAKLGGLQLGSIRETPAHGAGLALASVQLESSGQVPATLNFLAGLNTIGFPVLVDSVQFTADPMRPGQVKLNLTLLILDFSQQKDSQEAGHA
jgi:hypothetical protein